MAGKRPIKAIGIDALMLLKLIQWELSDSPEASVSLSDDTYEKIRELLAEAKIDYEVKL